MRRRNFSSAIIQAILNVALQIIHAPQKTKGIRIYSPPMAEYPRDLSAASIARIPTLNAIRNPAVIDVVFIKNALISFLSL